jgi:hypothetical protein
VSPRAHYLNHALGLRPRAAGTTNPRRAVRAEDGGRRKDQVRRRYGRSPDLSVPPVRDPHRPRQADGDEGP